jgi:hypothetical protein
MELRININTDLNLISVSAAIDRYMTMFDSLPNIEEYKPRIKKSVSLYILQLKKADRITWMCKLLKIRYLKRAKSAEIISKAEYEKAVSKIKLDSDKPAGSIEIGSIYDSLLHYLSLNIAGITNFEFKTQSPNAVMKEFDALEKEWKEKNGEGTLPETGTKIVEFPDGSAWFNLGVSVCTLEGKAMGHCGNAGSPQLGDNILSYRTPTKRGGWIPHLTFILTKNGYISEMKGRGNEKPNAKYHPQIIKLLKNRIVKGLTGGGYLPENNFSIMDLPEDQRNLLLAKKPTLKTSIDALAESLETFKKTKDVSTLETIGELLGKMPKREVIRIMRDATTPKAVVELVILDPTLSKDGNVVITALENPNIPAKYLRRAIKQHDDSLILPVCKNPKCPLVILEFCVETYHDEVLFAIIRNPNSTTELKQKAIRTLGYDPRKGGLW